MLIYHPLKVFSIYMFLPFLSGDLLLLAVLPRVPGLPHLRALRAEPEVGEQQRRHLEPARPRRHLRHLGRRRSRRREQRLAQAQPNLLVPGMVGFAVNLRYRDTNRQMQIQCN